MRIGIMLRSFDEKGGIGVYTRNLVAELLRFDDHNDYVLFYQNPENLGRFSQHRNVTEYHVRGGNKAVWDQIAIPFACWQKKVDLVFHPKFTAPILAPCKVVMTVHGADWFIPEQAKYYNWLDVRYIRAVMPFYFRKCARVISVSQLTTDNFNRALELPEGKVQTVYFAPSRQFHRITEEDILRRTRQQYALPERYILTLTKRAGDSRKNLDQVFRAYARYHALSDKPYKLVVGGKDCHLFKEEYEISDEGYGGDIHFPGWINQADLPAVYSMAGLYLYPSYLEAFPIPVTEAMACGTPVVTSNVNGLREIAGEAAVLVDPSDSEAIAQALCNVLSDSEVQSALSIKGLKRAERFNWDDCTRETLAILESVV